VGFEFKGLGPFGFDWVSFCGLVWFSCIYLLCTKERLTLFNKTFSYLSKNKKLYSHVP
jgi:hypothetical protein